MIYYNYETDFNLSNQAKITAWITNTIEEEKFKLDEISYIFCDDTYLIKKNIEYLYHDTFTDIISFDYTEGIHISGDIFISIERVRANAKEYHVDFMNELLRVIIHGVLHYCGYKDKTTFEKEKMREKENYYLSLANF